MNTCKHTVKTYHRIIGASLSEPYTWCQLRQEVERLSSIATSQPHAAYTAFTHGLVNKWTFLSRTIPDAEELFKPQEEMIRTRLIPSLTGQNSCNDDMRDLLALPTRLGGLGISNPSKQSSGHFHSSESITALLTNLVLQQSHSYPADAKAEQIRARNSTRNQRRNSEQRRARDLQEKLPSSLQKSMSLASEKGASTWLSTLPIEEHGFALHKGGFRDALCLRYGWQPTLLPSQCVYMRQEVQCWTRPQLPTWRLPVSEAQWSEGHHRRSPHWSLPWGGYWTSPTTCHWGAIHTPNCKPRRRGSTGHSRRKPLEQGQTTLILWREGVQPAIPNLPQYLSCTVLPQEWTWEEQSLWWTYQGNRTWQLLASRFFHFW